jgi:hypothetical protein
MTRRFRILTGVSVVVVLGLCLTIQLSAQEKKAKAPKPVTYQGSVFSTDKDKMMIAIKVDNVQRDVMYTADTKFMYGHSKDNKPGSVDAIKPGYYISCGGIPEPGKSQLTVKECVYRESK